MPVDDLLNRKDRSTFSEDYKTEVFMIWYKNSRPNSMFLHGMIPESEEGKKPSRNHLNLWIRDDFEVRAIPIDDAVREEMNSRLTQEKIEMLERHAKMGFEMQNIALEYLRANKKDLTPISAVRLLVEAVKIESGSRGIPDVLRKMMSMSDTDLLKETEKLLLRSPITEITPLDNTNYEPEDEQQLPDL